MAERTKSERFWQLIPNMSCYAYFVCVINIQFLPGLAAVITHRLDNSSGKHNTTRSPSSEAQTDSLNYPLEKILKALL